jgi:serine/threonine-protein kinase
VQYYVPELQAAAEIGVNEPEKALDSLTTLEQYDSISLTPYLRGMADEALGRIPAALIDFQMILDHRGMVMMLGSTSYPMAQMGVARANGIIRDKAGSVDAYHKFLMAWGEAEPDQPLVREASAKSK